MDGKQVRMFVCFF